VPAAEARVMLEDLSVSTVRTANKSTDDARAAKEFMVAQDPSLSTLQEGALEPLFDSPDDSVFFAETNGPDGQAVPTALCRVWVRGDAGREKVRVVWLYPTTLSRDELKSVFAAAMLDAFARHPASGLYLVEAFLATRQAALEWQVEFPGSQIVATDTEPVQWRIWLDRFSDALAVVRTWTEVAPSGR
jgi:hypothetical protein